MADRTKKAKRAIDEMFQDASRDQTETAENLRDIVEHCEALLESLDEED